MYSETLLTPHPFKAAAQDERLHLHEVAQLTQTASELAELQSNDPESFEVAKIEAAANIADHVGKTLWFPATNPWERAPVGAPALTVESITETQITNCFGYTMVTSECLEVAKIDHWIGYANGHAFLLVPQGQDDIFLLDPLSPRFNQSLGRSVSRGNQATITAQITDHDRAAVMLDTLSLSIRIGGTADDLAGKYPWLVFERGGNRTLGTGRTLGINEDTELAKYQSRYKLVMSVFGAKKGRQMLAQYMEFQAAMSHGDVEAASTSLRNMSGYYPELDARQSLDTIQQLVTTLCVTDPEAATELTDEFFESNFRLSQDSRIPVAKGDILRKIAQRSGYLTAAQKALDAYQAAAEHPRVFREAVVGKLATSAALMQELVGGHA